MSGAVRWSALGFALVLLTGLPARAQSADLTDAEVEELRDTQDPSARIGVYLKFEDARLERLANAPAGSDDAQRLLSQYIALQQELQDWIQDQYDHHADMRGGLRGLLEHGPHQLAQLRALERKPGATGDYADILHDAISNLDVTLNGSAKALSGQEKLFHKQKEERKADARATKERIKEEKKRQKQERKLRKKMEHEKPPEDP